MKKSSFFIAFIFLFTSWTYSQIDQMKKKIEDVGVESQGLFTIRFTNGADGAPVAYASIALQGNKTILTDIEGKVRFEKKPDGIYPIKFEKMGFISEDFKLEINAGKIRDNSFVVSPELIKNAFRIVLTWSEKPADLDAHFVEDGGYRVSSKDLEVSPDSLVMLEFESSVGYGPESIIIQNMDSVGKATFVVNDYSHKDDEASVALSKSNARIKVYKHKKLEYAWKPSKKQTGNVWMVFTIKESEIFPTEEVTND